MDIADISLDDWDQILESRAVYTESEDLRLRKLQPTGTTLPTPFVSSPLKALGLSPISSLQKADAPLPHRPSMPALAPPKAKENYLHKVSSTQEIFDEVNRGGMDLFYADTEQKRLYLKQLEGEIGKKLKAHEEAAKSENNWGAFGSAIQYVTSAASLLLGMSLIASGAGALPGWLLFTSGALGISARVLKDTGGLELIASWLTESHELQRSYASKIETLLLFTSMVLGLAGSGIAHVRDSYELIGLGTRSAKLKKFADALGFGSSIGSMVTHLGQAHHGKRSSKLEEEMTKLEALKTKINFEVTDEAKKAESTVESSTETTETCVQMIATAY